MKKIKRRNTSPEFAAKVKKRVADALANQKAASGYLEPESPAWYSHRETLMAEEKQRPLHWMYLSFVDNGFLGAVVIESHGPLTACERADELGINPGGEVLTADISNPRFPKEATNRLLNREEVTKYFGRTETSGEAMDRAKAEAISRDDEDRGFAQVRCDQGHFFGMCSEVAECMKTADGTGEPLECPICDPAFYETTEHDVHNTGLKMKFEKESIPMLLCSECAEQFQRPPCKEDVN